jgi:hypothetical protein
VESARSGWKIDRRHTRAASNHCPRGNQGARTRARDDFQQRSGNGPAPWDQQSQRSSGRLGGIWLICVVIGVGDAENDHAFQIAALCRQSIGLLRCAAPVGKLRPFRQRLCNFIVTSREHKKPGDASLLTSRENSRSGRHLGLRGVSDNSVIGFAFSN